jgi:hypothetical protein
MWSTLATLDNHREIERESPLCSSMCAQSMTCERKGLRALALVVCLFVQGERERGLRLCSWYLEGWKRMENVSAQDKYVLV